MKREGIFYEYWLFFIQYWVCTGPSLVLMALAVRSFLGPLLVIFTLSFWIFRWRHEESWGGGGGLIRGGERKLCIKNILVLKGMGIE